MKEEAEAAGAAKVNRVHIVLGEGRDIVLDYFESLFRFLARGTVAENAGIEIHTVPLMARCNVCNAEFHLVPIDKRTWTCPACGAPIQTHRACPSCGTYRGRKVLSVDTAKE